jgi:hypothetical protein
MQHLIIPGSNRSMEWPDIRCPASREHVGNRRDVPSQLVSLPHAGDGECRHKAISSHTTGHAATRTCRMLRRSPRHGYASGGGPYSLSDTGDRWQIRYSDSPQSQRAHSRIGPGIKANYITRSAPDEHRVPRRIPARGPRIPGLFMSRRNHAKLGARLMATQVCKPPFRLRSLTGRAKRPAHKAGLPLTELKESSIERV